jgi:DNA-binding NtrC family response regulator
VRIRLIGRLNGYSPREYTLLIGDSCRPLWSHVVAERTKARCHFRGVDAEARCAIVSGLTAAGITLLPPEASDADAADVLCFHETDDGLLECLRATARLPGRLIALAASRDSLPGRAGWRLLEAGAGDVLVWRPGPDVPAQIRARLERWSVIDLLAGSLPVQDSLVGKSQAWTALVRSVIEGARFTRSPVLLIGESGTGKELLARLIHAVGGRVEGRPASGELVTLDCTTIVPELSGSELFGHERGAFTGAVSARDGAFALADGGTLFLDEVGELPFHLQAQLLRAVQEKTYKRVGGNVWHRTDFRLVSATNLDLTGASSRGGFRQDLYYRIAGLVYRVPPLRERPEDILPLAAHFLKEHLADGQDREIEAPVREYLLNRAYPGNVRELRQLMLRIAHRHVGHGPISVGDIPEQDRQAIEESPRIWSTGLERAIAFAVASGVELKELNRFTSEAAIRIAVSEEQGSLQRAARRLGVTDRALQMRRASNLLKLPGGPLSH